MLNTSRRRRGALWLLALSFAATTGCIPSCNVAHVRPEQPPNYVAPRRHLPSEPRMWDPGFRPVELQPGQVLPLFWPEPWIEREARQPLMPPAPFDDWEQPRQVPFEHEPGPRRPLMPPAPFVQPKVTP